MGSEEASAPGGKGRSPYPETYLVYAARFGGSERTIKRWVALGVEKNDPCPLDDPLQLRGWWGRWMKHKVPDAIVAEAGKLEPLLEIPVHVPKPPVPEPPAAAPRQLVEMSAGDVGIHVLLEQAQYRAHQAHHAWMSAVTEDQASFAERRCIATAEAVRKIQKDADEAAIRMRDYIPRLEAETQLTEFHMDFLMRIRGLGEDLARALGISVTTELEARWNATIDSLCEQLNTEVFVEEGGE